MASTENKLLQMWLAPIFKTAGFKKTAATWHRATPHFIHVFNIQGSQWSRSFYFNLGVYILALGDADSPSEADCHVRERLDAIVPERKHFFLLSDFEQKLPEEQRRDELQTIVSRWAIPWLDRMSSTDELRRYILQEKKHGLPIAIATHEYLGIQSA